MEITETTTADPTTARTSARLAHRLPRRGLAFAAVAALALTACGGDDGAAGTYEHDEEGTITLDEDGTGNWDQGGDPFEFEWEADGDDLTFDADGDEMTASIEDGNLVIPDDFISGDEDVTFERQ